jgi:hypothetical protein
MAARPAGSRIPAGGVGLAIRARMTRSASCRRRARKQSGRHYSAASWALDSWALDTAMRAHAVAGTAR